MSDDWSEFTPVTKGNDPWAEFTPVPKDNYTLLSSLRHGAGDIASGIGNTVQVVGGGKGAASQGLKDVGNFVSGKDTESPTSVVLDSKRSLLDRAKAIPYALVEGSPGLATDLAAGALAGVAGGPFAEITAPLGFGASYAARTFGHNVDRAVSGRGGDANVQPTGQDYLRAGASTLAGAALSRLGAKGALDAPVDMVGKTVGDILPAIGTQVAKSAATDAATSAASNLADQALLDRKVDPSEALGAAALGGVQGGALRASKAPGEVNNGLKFRDINPEFGDRVADRFDGLDTTNPKASYDAVQQVEKGLKSEISTRQSEAAPVLKDHVEQSGFTSDLPETIRKVKDSLSSGEHLDDTDLAPIRDAIGHTREGARLVESLEDQNALNQIKAKGYYDPERKTFGGGITGSPIGQDVINPLGRIGRKADAGMIAADLLGVHVPGSFLPHNIDPTIAGAFIGGHVGLYGASRGIDSLLGNRSPLNEFTKRFGTDEGTTPTPPPSESLPSFRQQAAEDKAAEQKLKAIKSQSRLMKNSATLEQKQADAPLKQARQTAQIMRNSDSVAQKQADAPLQAAARTSTLMRNSDALEARQARQAQPTVANQESAAIPGMSNREVSDTKRSIQALMKREALKQKAQDQTLAAIKQTSGLMSRSEKGPTSDATTAIKVARLKQELSGEESPLKRPKNGQEKESTSEAGQPKSGPRQANPKGKSQESSPDKVVIRVGDQVVERPRANIRDVNAYATQTRRKMQVRHDAAAAAEKILPRQYRHSLHELLTRLNSSEGQRIDVSYGHIEDFVNSLPEKHWGHAMDILASPQVLATFRKED